MQIFHWQATFIFLSLFILLTIVLCYFILTETLLPIKHQSFSCIGIIKGSFKVLQNKQFLFYVLILCFAYASYFAYIVKSPFLLTTLGLSSVYIGYSYIGVPFICILGNLVARKFLKREVMEQTIRRGYIVLL